MSPESPPAHCANCGRPVNDRFCSHCGQRVESPVHSLSHFLPEVAEDLTHADSRLWRTLLALLFRPGLLTREFLDGRRVRYLPPLRLYLVVSLVFFVFASVAAAPVRVLTVSAEVKVRKLSDVKPEDCSQLQYTGPFETRIRDAFRNACRRTLEDHGKSLEDAVLHSISRAMFLFLPLLALVMMALYWRPRRYYIEHLLLFIHNHAFVFLAATLLGLLLQLLPAGGLATSLACAFVAYVTWYVYRSMRRVYGQSRARTLAKLLAVGFAYAVCAILMFIFTTVYSVLSV